MLRGGCAWVRRLRQYGVPDERIFITGFTLPRENIGGPGMETLKADLLARLGRLDPQGRFTSVYGATVRELLGNRPEPSGGAERVTVTFAVGGAGAQTEIGLMLAQGLKAGILDRRFRLVLVAGVNRVVEAVFREFVSSIGLAPMLGDGVLIVREDSKPAYFDRFNALMRETDILWTKPSELSFPDRLVQELGHPLVEIVREDTKPEMGGRDYLELATDLSFRHPPQHDRPSIGRLARMPLIDSGAALFAGSASEFCEMAPASRLTTHLTEAFRRRWGRVSESEVRAWRVSLTALASVASSAGLSTAGVGVELKLPLTDRRVDAFFVGQSASGRDTVQLIELKQWDSAAPSQFPDNVVVGGAEHLHPSVQAASYAEYLRASHSAFTEDGLHLNACAYLHNMPADEASSLRGIRYEGATTDAPLFVGGEEDRLAAVLGASVGHGMGEALLPKVVRGRYRPSLKLIESIRQSLNSTPIWTLLDEQRLAFNIVRGLTERAVKTGEKAVLIVAGGPGTGKSVIALHLMITLAQRDRRIVAHATGSKAFTTNLRALAPGAQAMFRYFFELRPAKVDENTLDVLICDEAHRIRKTSNHRFTPKSQRSGLPQAEELIRAAKVSVFFLDQLQNVRPDEIGSVSVIEEAAIRVGAEVHKQPLDAQFRCNGCPQYVQWVNSLMSASPEPVGGWLDAGDYDLRMFDRVDQMEQALLERHRTGSTARLAAGFCWPWSDPLPDGALVRDVVIDDWCRPWNEKAPDQWKGNKKGTTPRPDRHPYVQWATKPERVREVGCIYSAQGFEFDYFGVILGNDLVWREGIGWVASRDASHDPGIRRTKLSQIELLALLQQTYRVLFTRGMMGTFAYSTDWETLQMLKRLVAVTGRSA